MDYGIENIGTGAYTANRDIDVVSRGGLYASTYELVRRCSRTKNVLDLGCSDGVGTYGLDPSFYAVGIDFDGSSVNLANQIAHKRGAKGEGPRYEAVEASLTNLPPSLFSVSVTRPSTQLWPSTCWSTSNGRTPLRFWKRSARCFLQTTS